MLEKYCKLTKKFFNDNNIMYRVDERKDVVYFFIKNSMDEENLLRITNDEVFYCLGEEKYFDSHNINNALIKLKNDLENVIEINFYMKKTSNENFSVSDYISNNLKNQIKLIIEQMGLNKKNIDKIVIKNFMLTRFCYVEIKNDDYEIINSSKYLELENVFENFVGEVKKREYISNFEILINNKNFKFVKLQIREINIYIKFNDGIIETNVDNNCKYFYYDDIQQNMFQLDNLTKKNL